jgi:hypothetical protein
MFISFKLHRDIHESVTVFASLRRKRIVTIMPSIKPPEQDWRVLARQASIEEDPEMLLDLLQQVIEAYDRSETASSLTVDHGPIVIFSVAMPKLPEQLPVSPMSVTCPRCSANPGRNCVQLAEQVEGIHIERIHAAARSSASVDLLKFASTALAVLLVVGRWLSVGLGRK